MGQAKSAATILGGLGLAVGSLFTGGLLLPAAYSALTIGLGGITGLGVVIGGCAHAGLESSKRKENRLVYFLTNGVTISGEDYFKVRKNHDDDMPNVLMNSDDGSDYRFREFDRYDYALKRTNCGKFDSYFYDKITKKYQREESDITILPFTKVKTEKTSKKTKNNKTTYRSKVDEQLESIAKRFTTPAPAAPTAPTPAPTVPVPANVATPQEMAFFELISEKADEYRANAGNAVAQTAIRNDMIQARDDLAAANPTKLPVYSAAITLAGVPV